MSLKVRRTSSKNIRYGNLRGSGLIPRVSSVCILDKCKPKPFEAPKTPKPVSRTKFELEPLIAKKQGLDTNKWELNGQLYPNFNSLWVNIPSQQYTRLKLK